MTLDFTIYEGYQSIADIIADNSETMDYVRTTVTWAIENPDPFTSPVLLMITDLHFTDKLTGETNLPIDAFRSIMSAPLFEGEAEP